MVTVNKGPKWYPAHDVKKPVGSRKHVHNATKLRPSIRAGSVLILLAGSHRGAHVIFLKQLASGSLLVTGPYSVNRIPLKRVDQAYVIATSTIVDVSGVDVKKIDDAYFAKDKKPKVAAVMEVDTVEDKKVAPSAERIADQKAVDAVLVPKIDKEAFLANYLKSKFTLKKGQYPHEMKF